MFIEQIGCFFFKRVVFLLSEVLYFFSCKDKLNRNGNYWDHFQRHVYCIFNGVQSIMKISEDYISYVKDLMHKCTF